MGDKEKRNKKKPRYKITKKPPDPSSGGAARAKRLSAEERSEIARAGAAARWGTADAMPRATYGDPSKPLKIGEIELPAYVLDDGRRVLAHRGLKQSLGMSEFGGASRMVDFAISLAPKDETPNDLTARAATLADRLRNPIPFLMPHGGKALGVEATILPELCDLVLAARKSGVLPKRHEHIAEQCEVLVRGMAQVGIIALVDEVTGFQDVRARDALAQILEKFIAKELRPWQRTFDPDFYREVYRLHGWEFKEDSSARPIILGKITNDVVYSRLAPGVLEELKRTTPRHGSGRVKHHYHRKLTGDIGHPKLKEHLAGSVALLKISPTWKWFMESLDRVYPRFNETLLLPFSDVSNGDSNDK